MLNTYSAQPQNQTRQPTRSTPPYIPQKKKTHLIHPRTPPSSPPVSHPTRTVRSDRRRTTPTPHLPKAPAGHGAFPPSVGTRRRHEPPLECRDLRRAPSLEVPRSPLPDDPGRFPTSTVCPPRRPPTSAARRPASSFSLPSSAAGSNYRTAPPYAAPPPRSSLRRAARSSLCAPPASFPVRRPCLLLPTPLRPLLCRAQQVTSGGAPPLPPSASRRGSRPPRLRSWLKHASLEASQRGRRPARLPGGSPSSAPRRAALGGPPTSSALGGHRSFPNIPARSPAATDLPCIPHGYWCHRPCTAQIPATGGVPPRVRLLSCCR